MVDHHFIRDYENHVKHLKNTMPIDDAMSEAVGGGFDIVGKIECDLLRYAGLTNGLSILDFGCGSGRLAVQLSRNFDIDYNGIDVVNDLLEYAKTKTPANYSYHLNRSLELPFEDGRFDFVSCFSVFTHLRHSETYIYLEEMQRVLKPSGVLVFSFLEFADDAHWHAFETNFSAMKKNNMTHLDQFIERNQIETWCRHLGFRIREFISGTENPWMTSASLGQAVVILESL